MRVNMRVNRVAQADHADFCLLDWPDKNPIPNNQVLHVWKNLAPQFPRVARMARDVLCVPGAGVSVEQMFSQARHQGRFNRTYSKSAFRAVMMGRSRLAAERKMRDTIINGPQAEQFNVGDDDLAGEAALDDYRARVDSMRSMWNIEMISDDENAPVGGTKKRRRRLDASDDGRRRRTTGGVQVVLPRVTQLDQ